MTPKMAAFQVRRQARNRLAPRFSNRYQAALDRRSERLAALSSLATGEPALAAFIGNYYESSTDQLDAARKGTFTFFGRTVEFGSVEQIDWRHQLPEERDHHLWRMKLTQVEVAHSLFRSGDLQSQQLAIDLLASATSSIPATAPDAFATSWAPYGVSHRLLAVLSGLVLASRLGEIPTAILTKAADFARSDAAFLWRNVEHDLRNNHTERNLAALCYFHAVSGTVTPAQRRYLNRQVRSLVLATVLPDGTQIERSPMYQGLTVMSLRIFADCQFLSESTRALCSTRYKAACDAWFFLTHADGQIALFNDSWLGDGPAPSQVLQLGETAQLTELPDAGYFKIRGSEVTALMDAGGIGPRWNPGHGHADFLSLEVDVAGKRLVVDPGTSQYSTGAQRTHERSAVSHNGPRVLGVEPVEYIGCFKVGRLADASPIPKAVLPPLERPIFGGTLVTRDVAVARVVTVLGCGGLLVVDYWSPRQSEGATGLLIPTDWLIRRTGPSTVEATFDEQTATVQAVIGDMAPVGSSLWCRFFMSPEDAHDIQLTPRQMSDASQLLAFTVGASNTQEARELSVQIGQSLARLKSMNR